MIWFAFIFAMLMYAYQVYLSYSPEMHVKWFYYPIIVVTAIAITLVWSWTAKVVQPERLITYAAVWDLVMVGMSLFYPFVFKDSPMSPLALLGVTMMVLGCIFVNLSGVRP